jgi:hypothetical protein
MKEYKNNGSFICDRCRNTCKGGCHEKLMEIMSGDLSHYEENKDLVGRKQIIHCLGKYCDNPCELQREEYTPFNEEDKIQPLMELIHWMGNKIHYLIEENNKLKK